MIRQTARTRSGCLAIAVLAAALLSPWPAPAAAPSCTPPAGDAVERVDIADTRRGGETATVTGYLLKPPGAGPFPAVVLLHGSGGHQPGYLCIAEKMVGWGYVALAIDSNSTPSTDRLYAMGGFLDTEQAQDAHRGRRLLASRPYVDGGRIGVIGWSAGGQATLTAVSSHRTFASGKWHDVDRDGAFAAAVAVYPVCHAALEDLDAPLLILIGANDTSVSATYCATMARTSRSNVEIELKIYPDAVHGFDGPWSGWTAGTAGAPDARRRIKAFFDRHLN